MAAQQFPPLLKWTLLGTIAVNIMMMLAGPGSPETRVVAGVLASISLLVQLVAVPIAIRFLLRPEYRSPANIAMTVAAALPWVVLIVGVTLLFMGIGHFHI